MMIAVTAWQITCNVCGAEFTAPRAQDYWSADEIDRDLDWRLEANDWTRSEDGTQHHCRDCNGTLEPGPVAVTLDELFSGYDA